MFQRNLHFLSSLFGSLYLPKRLEWVDLYSSPGPNCFVLKAFCADLLFCGSRVTSCLLSFLSLMCPTDSENKELSDLGKVR